MSKKIGPLLLSGLMIGPILGSGIILLPPMAYKQIGAWSFMAWLVIMTLGVLFAMSFSKLAIIRPGDGGMTNAIEEGLNSKWKIFSSFAMIAAVLAGPAVVLYTAADYLSELSLLSKVSNTSISIILVLFACGLLMKDLKIISTISLVISSIIALILIVSSILVLFDHGVIILADGPINPIIFGKTTLLLFWAIIGWEVIGNYSGQVKDVKKTMPKATLLSLIVITSTYVLIALAVNSIGTKDMTLTPIISPIFGESSSLVLALLITGLCLSTYLLIIGAIARLIRSLAREQYLPRFFLTSNEKGIPFVGILTLGLSHIIVLALASNQILTMDAIVRWANGFFVINAIIGLIAASKLSTDLWFRVACIFLVASLSLLFLFSSYITFIASIILYILAIRLSKINSMN